MTDNSQSQGQYSGGFAFGNQQNPPQSIPPAAPAPLQPYAYPAPAAPAPAPVPPAYQAPPAPMPPAPPAYPAPAPGAPTDPGAYGQDPFGGGGSALGPQDPNHDPNYIFADRMKTFTTTIKLPAHELTFDEAYFLNLLAGSISLTKDEKKKIIDSMSKLRQAQVDELIRIFEEERAKFIELSPKHGAQLKKLEDEHQADWKDIELSYKQEAKSEEDAAQADEIRKQLGL